MPFAMQRVATFERALEIQKWEIAHFFDDGLYIRETHIKRDNNYKPEAGLGWEVLVVAGYPEDAARSRKGEVG